MIMFGDAINNAALDLPEGWTIMIHVSKNEISVVLSDPGVGKLRTFDCGTVEEKFAEAVRIARGEV